MVQRFSTFVVMAAFVTFLGFPQAFAERSPGNLGIGLGSATMTSGISVKQFAGPTAFQLTAGCWQSCDGPAASLDFLYNMPAFVTTEAVLLAWNMGFGGALGFGDGELGAGAAFIAGLEFLFQPLPFDLVLEWRPGLYVLPDIDITLVNFGGHLRFYFF